MYIGLEIASILEPSLEEKIRWIESAGFEEIEIYACPNPSIHRGIWARKLESGEVKNIKRMTKNFKAIDLHAPFQNTFDISLVSPNPLVRKLALEEITLAIRLARKLNANVVTFHTGWSCVGMTKREEYDYLVDSLQKIDREAGEIGIRLGAEVADYFMPVDKFVLLEKLNLRNIGITLDIGHVSFDWGDGVMYRNFGTIGKFIERFKDKIFHVHLHDYDGKNDHIALGEGKIDFENAINSLVKIGYRGSLCLEFNHELQINAY